MSDERQFLQPYGKLVERIDTLEALLDVKNALIEGMARELAELQTWKAEALAFYEPDESGQTWVERKVLRAEVPVTDWRTK